MSADQISADQMSADQMSINQMYFWLSVLTKWCETHKFLFALESRKKQMIFIVHSYSIQKMNEIWYHLLYQVFHFMTNGKEKAAHMRP
jgi:hypothetical protein